MPETIVKAKRYVMLPVDQYFWSVLDPGEPSINPPLAVNEFPDPATEEKISPLNFSATPYTPYDATMDYRDYRAVLNFIYGTELDAWDSKENLRHVGHKGVVIVDTDQETGEDYDLD